jgi:hypothetical protein
MIVWKSIFLTLCTQCIDCEHKYYTARYAACSWISPLVDPFRIVTVNIMYGEGWVKTTWHVLYQHHVNIPLSSCWTPNTRCRDDITVSITCGEGWVNITSSSLWTSPTHHLYDISIFQNVHDQYPIFKRWHLREVNHCRICLQSITLS